MNGIHAASWPPVEVLALGPAPGRQPARQAAARRSPGCRRFPLRPWRACRLPIRPRPPRPARGRWPACLCREKATPGACSPSRSVVSTISSGLWLGRVIDTCYAISNSSAAAALLQGVEDVIDLLLSHLVVPPGVGIDDQDRALFADIQATGGRDDGVDAAVADLGLQVLQQVRGALLVADALRLARWRGSCCRGRSGTVVFAWGFGVRS